MYRWIVFLHVISTFLFMLSHGTAVVVMFKVKGEDQPERARLLLDLARSNETLTYASFGGLLLTGTLLGFLGRWWSHGWIWASLITLVVIYLVMGYFGRGYFEPLIKNLTPSDNPGHIVISREKFESLLAAGRPVLMTLVGLGGWTLIVWLMMFKPF
jgi:hypothetical protein